MGDSDAVNDRMFYRTLKQFMSNKSPEGPSWQDWMKLYGAVSSEEVKELDELYDKIENSSQESYSENLDAYNKKITDLVGSTDLCSSGRSDNLILKSSVSSIDHFTKFASILKVIKSKTSTGVSANQSEIKEQFMNNLELFLRFGMTDDEFLKPRMNSHSRCKSWFNAFDENEKKNILERLNNSEHTEKDRYLEECKEVSDSPRGISNKLQMCYPMNILVSARKADLEIKELDDLVTKLSEISNFKPFTKKTWEIVCKSDSVARRVDQILHQRPIDLMSHPHLVTPARFFKACIMMGRGICDMSLTTIKCNLNDVIELVGKTSVNDIIDESDRGKTSRSEHLVHMLCLTNQGDGARIRTNIKRNIRDVHVQIT